MHFFFDLTYYLFSNNVSEILFLKTRFCQFSGFQQKKGDL